MSQKSAAENLSLGRKHPAKSSLKFPLNLVSEPVRPYLELIRLEKVNREADKGFVINDPSTANRNNSHILAIWCVTPCQ
jgi:hypothetical protein